MIISKFHFEVVHGCQLRCVGCPNSTRRPSIKHVDIDIYKLCLANVDVKRVELFRLFNFGEPTLHPDLPMLVRMAKQQRWKCKQIEISTNGQHIDRKQLEDLFRDKCLTRLIVSCDGDGTPQMYEKLRPPAKWGKLVEFLETVSELREQCKSKVRLVTRTIIEHPKYKSRWEKMLLPLGWKPEFRDMLKMPEASQNPFNKKYKKHTGLCGYMRKPKLYVDYNGDVVPCCAHPRAFVLGNLLTQKYSDIVAGKKRKRAVQIMKRHRNSMSICKECGIP